MDVILAAALGIAGAILREAFELGDILRHRRGAWPDEWRGMSFYFAEALRIIAGGLLAATLAGINELGFLSAFVVGMFGPSLVRYVLDPFQRHAR